MDTIEKIVISSRRQKIEESMKRIYLVLIAVLMSTALFAQSKAEKTQGVALNILGVQYYNETPVGKQSTLIFHGGLAGEVAYSSSSLYFSDNELYYGESWASSVRGALGVEYRYYYNLAKRAQKGKNTRKNSANFISVDLQEYTSGLYSHNMDTKNIILLTPSWGLRRVYRNNLYIEFNAGIVVGCQGTDFGMAPTANFKFGYSF